MSTVSAITPDSWIDYDVEHLINPDQETLRDLTLEHTPAVLRTRFDSLNKVSRNKARQAQYTYIITDADGGVRAWGEIDELAIDKAAAR